MTMTGFWADDAEAAEAGADGQQDTQAPAQQQQQQPDLTQTVQSIAQALGNIQQGQTELSNRLGFMQRRINDLEASGKNVPAALRQQLEAVASALEEQKVADMTTDEKLEFYRKKATDQRTTTTDDNEVESAPDLTEVARQQYPAVEKRLNRLADALGLPFDDRLKGELRKIPVNANNDGDLQWDEWEDTASGYLKSVADYFEKQAQTQAAQQTPARAAGRSLGGNSRPGGAAMPQEPDFFTASTEDTIRHALAMERAQGRRR